jgi:hypothetical protein
MISEKRAIHKKMRIMDIVWPITAFYLGPLALWSYWHIGHFNIEKKVSIMQEIKNADDDAEEEGQNQRDQGQRTKSSRLLFPCLPVQFSRREQDRRSSNTKATSSHNVIVAFFSGFWGEVILLVSFGLMLVGIWFNGKRKVMPLSVAGIVILYVSMYVYYSIGLEVAGTVILAIAYTSAYSYKVAKTVKLA